MKSGWNIRFSNYFLIENGHGPGPELGGPRATLVHGGPQIGPRRRLAGGRSEWRPHAWNHTVVEEEGGGNGGDPHRLQEGKAEGRKWPGIGGE
jgi:hypothetical protein